MTRKALIKIIGKQHFGADSDKIELTTVGTLEETPETYIFQYQEETEETLPPVSATLRIFKDKSRVEMIRAGKDGSCLIIERSKRNLCTYPTGYGDLLMGIYGKNIESDVARDKGSFTFGYDIDINGALTSQNEVIVEYKIN